MKKKQPDTPSSIRHAKLWGPLSAAAFLIGAAWLLHRWLTPYVAGNALQTWLNSYGRAAPLVFVIAYTIRPVAFVPSFIFSVAGGVLFGPWLGMLYANIGGMTSAMLGFYVARRLGRDWVKRRLRESKWATIESALEANGFVTTVSIRLFPLSPFDVTSYAAGVSSISAAAFFWATLLGNLPWTIAYSVLGDSLGGGNAVRWLITGAVCTVASAMPWLYRRWHRRQELFRQPE